MIICLRQGYRFKINDLGGQFSVKMDGIVDAYINTKLNPTNTEKSEPIALPMQTRMYFKCRPIGIPNDGALLSQEGALASSKRIILFLVRPNAHRKLETPCRRNGTTCKSRGRNPQVP